MQRCQIFQDGTSWKSAWLSSAKENVSFDLWQPAAKLDNSIYNRALMEGLYKSIVHYDIKTMDLKEEHKSTNFKRFF